MQTAPRPGNVPALQANYLHGLASGHKLHPFRQPANYLHGLARRLRKPFPFRQPANYLHGLARRPYRYEGLLEGAT